MKTVYTFSAKKTTLNSSRNDFTGGVAIVKDCRHDYLRGLLRIDMDYFNSEEHASDPNFSPLTLSQYQDSKLQQIPTYIEQSDVKQPYTDDQIEEIILDHLAKYGLQ